MQNSYPHFLKKATYFKIQQGKISGCEFKPVNAEQLAWQWLQQLHQINTVEQYICEFHSLIPKLPDIDTKDALFNFVQGLKYQCHLQVLMQKPFSLLEVYVYT